MADPVEVTQQVSGRVTNLVVTRSGTDLKAEWKIPPYMTDDQRADRALFLDAVVRFYPTLYPRMVEVWDPREGSGIGPGDTPLNEYKNADVFWIKGLALHTDVTLSYDRNRYYPVTDTVCKSVEFSVHGGNGVGGGDIHDLRSLARGPETTVTYNFQPPKPPSVSDWSVDSTNKNKISCDISFDDGSNEYELYDGLYTITRRDNISAAYKTLSPVLDWTQISEKSKHVEYTVPDALSLSQNQFVEIVVSAYSRGMAGNSRSVPKKKVFAWPSKPTITDISASSLDNSGILTVKFKTNASETRPIELIELERAITQSGDPYYSNPADVPGEKFQSVSGATGIATSTGIADSVGSAKPGRGKQTFYRLKATNGTYWLYSDAFEAKCLFTEGKTSAHDLVGIESVSANEDATVVYVDLGWNNDNSDDTEITYSDHEDAWESTAKPTAATVDWEDDTPRSGSGYQHTATLSIYDAEEGVPMYIKGRRHGTDSDGNDSYGPYVTPSEAYYPFVPVTKPTDVQLEAPSLIERGKDLSISWTFQSTSEQSAWVVYVVPNADAPADNRTILASGNDDNGATKIPYSKFEQVGDHMHILVSMTTGSEWADSPVETITVADKPVIEAVVSTPCVIQPLVVYASSDTGNDQLVVKIFSLGIAVDKPDRDVDQMYGDVVWSGVTDPPWGVNPVDQKYYTAISLPRGLEFYDLGWYRISVVGVNKESGLSSEEQVMDFNVKWLHQAMMPSALTMIETFEEERSARITPVQPSNYEDGDVYDLYRVTPTNVYLIASGMAYGTSVLDRYAPFSKTADLRYRVCNRTADGDFAWRDVSYRIRGGARMRFDWGRNHHLELPYNLTQNDSLSKDAEIRSHLNGGRSGYWNDNVTHKADMTAKLVKMDEPEQLELVYKMGNYPGPVFVRLPDGQAFQSNTDVGSVDRSFDELIMGVSLKSEEINLTDEFRIRNDDVIYPPLEEEEPVVLNKSRILQWSTHVPSITDSFPIPELPNGEYRVSLSSSFNFYMETYVIETAYCDVVGDQPTVHLGHDGDSLSEDIADYIASAIADDPNAQFLLKFDYNMELEETSEE